MTNDQKNIFCKIWLYLGITLIGILALWAGDWWSQKLFATIPIGVAAYFSVVIPGAGIATPVSESQGDEGDPNKQ